jgi:FkbM family methyltransferase
MFILNLIKKLAIKFNYEIINTKAHKKYNTINTIKFLINKIKKKKIIIFDVGANVGDFSHNLRKACESLNKIPIIHCFEPNKKLIPIINNTLGSKNIFINKYGLGQKICKKIFYIHESHVKSSFLKIDKNFFLNRKKYKIKKKIEKVNTLDNYRKIHNIKSIDFLKIDTQSFNEEVIAGAKNSLKNEKIKIIYTEITLGRKYSKSESFIEVRAILTDPQPSKAVNII